VSRGVYPRPITAIAIRGSVECGAGWGRFTSAPLDVREFDLEATPAHPLAHVAMMKESNVALFAEEFQSFLRRTRRSPSSPEREHGPVARTPRLGVADRSADPSVLAPTTSSAVMTAEPARRS
jgi:hypothetical protein